MGKWLEFPLMKEKYKSAVYGAIIGDSVKTGINSSFSPGVKVGSNSTIGSNVLLYEDLPSDTRVLLKQNHIIQDKNKDDK